MAAVLLVLTGLGQAFGGELAGVTPDELQALQEHGALVVDVRAPEEWKTTGLIADSLKLTYFDKNGQYDQPTWLHQLRGQLKSADQPIVLVCRSGNRSAMVGKMLAQEPGFGKVYHLEKGIKAWLAESRGLVSP